MADEVRWLESVGSGDVEEVGGKNASLGEMIGNLSERGIRVPGGFATTATAYRSFLTENALDEKIAGILSELSDGERELADAGQAIRDLFDQAVFPEATAEAIRSAYAELGERHGTEDIDVAVRSSATAEDLPDASFAGQQDTYLNITGAEALLAACKDCYASLFTDRAISYRVEQGFEHTDVALSIGIQTMVRADLGSAGVMFTIDSDTGFPDTAIINAAWGLGENVVGGEVTPDQYTVYKPFLDREELRPIIARTVGAKERKLVYTDSSEEPTENVDTTEEERRSLVLDDDEILQLARWGTVIEEHYGRPMDVEWAKDGRSGELYVVQARPETVQSRAGAGTLSTFHLNESGEVIVSGLAIGQQVAAGEVQVIASADDVDQFTDGKVLVTEMTDPDWVPIMRRAAAIVTDRGGRTSHAAIVSRELGVPAIVGTGNATEILGEGREVTISCVEGDEGHVYEGLLDYEERELDLGGVPEATTRVMMNIGSPAAAMQWWRLPAHGIGLARMEYLVNNVIQAHPLALLHLDDVEDDDARRQIEELTAGWDDKGEYFVDHLARGIATIAASQYPEPVVVRLSDFKTNEYAGLIGGTQFEPDEENPMLGWRGASRYYSDDYKEAFALECRALRRVRTEMGFTNVIVMVPFCRTPEEADRVLETMAEYGLERGQDELQVYVMAEIPSNILQADEFADRFDGFSIGSNDLTQLTLGIGRDDDRLTHLFDERSPAVKKMITMLIEAAHAKGRYVGICGQGPSDHPDLAEFLVEQGIDSMSLNPDSVLTVIERVAEAEKGSRGGG
ncbi:phosphoenolpyruvate synthase [Actinomycetospora sp. NBRC 106375]|uniref:phosphoenolpyruvate synthase n=1 Tax=Actinomycetospora sp. NBRC 106375 TaxID=3032207 RepID=UPI0024A09843|nr:phosphoenolpyruvate synthase [Actinomycetospora sp. NBRC 106375]GLZ45212.1 phosphoenolpyruvate synthase [Actinomycetospora sp. NBRC 106375]